MKNQPDKPKRIGILTFHDGLNHGAYLQAYATYKTLESWGYSPEMINYKNPRHFLREDVRPWLHYRHPRRFIDHSQKSQGFRKDHEKLVMSTKTRSAKKITGKRYDTVIIGSDVVWNYKIFGYDDLYFGGVNAKNIIAYAASCGWVNANAEHPAEIKPALTRFSSISVRDENTRAFVQNLGLPDPPLVLDPTLIYPFTTEKAESFKSALNQPYTLVYSYRSPSDAEIKNTRARAKQEGRLLVGTGYRHDWCDINLLNLGPLDWIRMIEGADSMITSTYHGAIFALKAQKHFWFIKNAKAYNRVKTLFDLYNIPPLPSSSAEGDLLEITPDSVHHEKMNQMISFSREWLKKSIEI